MTRRNLDRVLYFAQYMITHVDEGARQKAMHRLEEELKHKIERETRTIQDKIETLSLPFFNKRLCQTDVGLIRRFNGD